MFPADDCDDYIDKWRPNESRSSTRVEQPNKEVNLKISQRFVASQETVASSQDVALSKDRSNSPHLSTSEPDVRNILRYSRESLLGLRDSELSKRKPEQLGRAWIRIGISSDGERLFINKFDHELCFAQFCSKINFFFLFNV